MTINDLPNELFNVIFRFLYGMHWTREMQFPDEIPSGNLGCWLGDPFDPSMFPFAQAKVCRRWRALLAYYPKYWTRIPIVVDPATTPLHHVPDYLAWSQDLPIDVFVISHPDAHYMHGLDEKSYVDAILPYISQHLYHIRSIEFSLHHACIPNLPRWLVGPANLLESIQLSHEECPVVTPCVTHDHDSDPQIDGDPENFRFSAPNLKWLSIDWRTFVQACRTNMSWLVHARKLCVIKITPPGRCSPVENLSVQDTIQALSQCERKLCSGHLSIRRIPFADDAQYFELPDTPWSCDSLEFEGLKGTEVAKFVDAGGVPVSFLTIKNCSLVGLRGFTAFKLVLEGLDKDCDLTETFGDVTTIETIFSNCPAFNDAFLEFMADGDLTGEDFPARGLRWLRLDQCTNFSVECLYRMVLSRRMAMEASPEWDGTEDGLDGNDADDLSAILSLHVLGGPLLAGYRAKFEELVPDFIWTSNT